jgi:ribose transport system permease protein
MKRLRMSGVRAKASATPIAALVGVCVLFAVLNPTFASLANAKVILGDAAVLMLVSLGMTTVVRTGGVDLSLAVSLDLGAMVSIALLHDNYIFVIAIAGGMLAGVVVGAVNAVLIVGVGMDPVLTTLGTLFVGEGIQQVYTQGGATIFIPPETAPTAFQTLGQGTLLGFPVPMFVALGGVLIFWVILERARYGRSLAAIGAQRRAAEIAGLRVRRDLVIAYLLSGLVGAVAGITLSATISSFNPESGFSYLLDAVGAVFIGATLHREGRPNVIGSVVGVLFFGIVANGMNLAGLPFQWQTMVKGILLLAILLLNLALRQERAVLRQIVRAIAASVQTTSWRSAR